MGRDPSSRARRDRGHPEIAFRSEDDPVSVNVRPPEKRGRPLGDGDGRRAKKRDQD